MRVIRSLVIAALGCALLGSGLRGAEPATPPWNQFRGPGGEGRAEGAKLPLTWSEQEHVLWKTPIHDRGWSSPVVWGQQIWLTTATADGHKLYAVCVDVESGKVVHDLLVFEVAEPRFCHPTNSYASPTPYVEEGRVYVHFGAYGTACLDTATGNKLWERRDFVSDDFRGPGSSPIVDGDNVYIHFDGVDFQFVVSLDKGTGETVWRREREIDYGTDNGDRKKAYGTPSFIVHHGRRQMVSPSATETIAYDPATGEELWRVRHGGMNAAARPLYRDGLLFIAAGDGDRSLIAVRPDGEGRLPDSQIVWGTNQGVPLRPSFVIGDGLMFIINDGGVASCLDAASGKSVWRERLQGDYWASPLLAGGRLYGFSKDGRCPVLAAGPEFKVLAENKLDDGFVASPAVVGDTLILRTATHLYRIGD